MTAFATISNSAGSRGLATAVAAGTTSITATFGGVTGSRSLTVTNATLSSIVVSPGGPFLPKGTLQFFTATGIYSDGSAQDLTTAVSWSSDATAVATVDNGAGVEGLVTAVAAGSANITATDSMSGKSGSTKVTVTNASLVLIAITPAGASIAKGTTVQLTATGTYSDGRTADITAQVTWSSSNTNVSVSQAMGTEGLATGLGVSTATITAQLSGRTGTTTLTVTAATLMSIAVTPVSAMPPARYSLQYTAVGTYSDATMQDLTQSVTWDSSDATVATIANGAGSQGLATGVAAGTINIKATLGTVIGTTTLTVTSDPLMSIAITPATVTIPAGGTQQFTATGTFTGRLTLDLTTQVTWSSDKPATVAIDPTTGFATAPGAAADTATITATISGMSTTAAVTLG